MGDMGTLIKISHLHSMDYVKSIVYDALVTF